MNFKRPCWLTLFVSLALIPLFLGCAAAIPLIFQILGIDNGKPPGSVDLIVIAFILLTIPAGVVAVIAAISCLFVAVFSVLRSEKVKRILYGKR